MAEDYKMPSAYRAVPSVATDHTGTPAMADPTDPSRIRARVVHCKREPYDVLIDRTTKWGNPYPVPKGYDRVADPERILERYEEHVRSRPDLVEALPELRGKVLGCWCAPQRCHGDVLVRLAEERSDG